MAASDKSSGSKSKLEQAQTNAKKNNKDKLKAKPMFSKSKWANIKTVYTRPR